MIRRFAELASGLDGDVLADVCIIGGGPAGISLALALEGSGRRVVLLESGERALEDAYQDLFDGTQGGDLPPLRLRESRLRQLGGATNHWGGACAPLDAIDFEERPWIAGSGWPIRRSDLDPYYARAHELLELGAPGFAPEHFGGDVGALFALGDTEVVHRVRIANPLRFGEHFHGRLERAVDVEVWLGATAVGLDLRADGGAVEAVRVRSLDGHDARVRAGRVIVACGGVENARFLLHCGLGERLDAIGRYYTWHPRLDTGLLLLSGPMPDPYRYDWHVHAGRSIDFTLGLSRQAQEFEEVPNHGFFLYPVRTGVAGAVDALDARLRGREPLAGMLDDLGKVADDPEAARAHWDGRGSLVVQTWIDQVPNPDSRVTLGREADAVGMRRAHTVWRIHDYERDWLITVNAYLAAQLALAGVGRMRLNEELGGGDAYPRGIFEAGGGGHQIGTTRMSQGPADGVVDADLRVHGIANLYCAGSSVFRTASWVNPTYTVVALSLRLAEHLRAEFDR